MSDGWIKMHRQLKDHPRFNDSEWVHVWLWLLLSATHAPLRRIIDGEVTELKPGQLITSRKSISEATGVQESKVERILNQLKTEHQIEQQTHAKCRVITVLKWGSFQNVEHQNEQQVNSNRTASEHTQEQKNIISSSLSLGGGEENTTSTQPAPKIKADSGRIESIHRWYCNSMGGKLQLDGNLQSVWFNWFRAGFSEQQFQFVFRYLDKQVRERKRNHGCLKLVNLLQPDTFAQDLLLAQKAKKPTAAIPATLATVSAPMSPEEAAKGVQMARELREKLEKGELV